VHHCAPRHLTRDVTEVREQALVAYIWPSYEHASRRAGFREVASKVPTFIPSNVSSYVSGESCACVRVCSTDGNYPAVYALIPAGRDVETSLVGTSQVSKPQVHPSDR